MNKGPLGSFSNVKSLVNWVIDNKEDGEDSCDVNVRCQLDWVWNHPVDAPLGPLQGVFREG